MTPITAAAAALRSDRDTMAELTLELVEAESPSSDPASQAAVQAILERELDAIDFGVRRIPGSTSGGSLLAVPRWRDKGGPIQLLVGHCDTVWPTGTIAERPPGISAGRLQGAGSYDMKAGLAQGLGALRVLGDLGVRPSVAPVLLINSDEEIGSRDSAPHIARLAAISDRAFILEPSLGPNGALKTARKGVASYTLRVSGVAAHAGLDPGKGASAIVELSRLVQELFALNDVERGISVNVGTIQGGIRPNVVAPESEAVVDVRVWTHEDAARVDAAIRALEAETPGTVLTVEGEFGRPPMEETDGTTRLWKSAEAIAAELGITITSARAGGASDGNETSQLIPTLDGLGAVGDGAHATHEYVEVERMPERAALLAGLLLEQPLGRPT